MSSYLDDYRISIPDEEYERVFSRPRPSSYSTYDYPPLLPPSRRSREEKESTVSKVLKYGTAGLGAAATALGLYNALKNSGGLKSISNAISMFKGKGLRKKRKKRGGKLKKCRSVRRYRR